MECPFCMPGVKKSLFAESENFRAIYNIAPILPGHSLIIPKTHYEAYLDIPDYQLLELVQFQRTVMNKLEKAFKPDGFDITVQDGVCAGQTVNHTHVHIIPRYENDMPNPGDWYPKLEKNQKKIIDSVSRANLNDQQMKDIIEMLKKC
ncbi:MAG: HIT family protein [Bacteroidales bacterium]|nr:HIT family protein [Bacteroidales bacterium]